MKVNLQISIKSIIIKVLKMTNKLIFKNSVSPLQISIFLKQLYSTIIIFSLSNNSSPVTLQSFTLSNISSQQLYLLMTYSHT